MYSQVCARTAPPGQLLRRMTTIRSPHAAAVFATLALATAPATATGSAPFDQTKRTLPTNSRKLEAKTVQLESIVDLDNVPQSWFRPTEPEGWTIRRSPNYTGGGIPPAVKGVYAEFFRVALPGHSCGEYHARGTVDLSQLRANGFRLVEYLYENVPAPAGYSFDRNGGPNRRPANPAPRDIIELNVSAAILVAAQLLDNRYPHPCWSGIHVRLKVAGPAGVDPLTGKPIRPRRPVN